MRGFLLLICGVLGGAQPTCEDLPGWSDAEGYECAEYANQSWCTLNGTKGSGWRPNMGDLEDQWNQGFTAQSACCSCGGGRQPIAGAWQVLRGPCSVDAEGCLLSPNYPENYSDLQQCTILVNSTLARPIHTILWDVEYWYDYLLINGRLFSGSLKPDGQLPNGSIHWLADEDTTGQGWKICMDSQVSTSSAAPAATPAAAPATTISQTPETTRPETTSTTSSTPLPQPARACKDVEDWIDSVDFSCNEYKELQWCTESGRPGANWNPIWGDLRDYWHFGYDATTACCACGGGAVQSIPTMWMVLAGNCTIVEGCIQSPMYPRNYSNNERCTIVVNHTLAKPLQVIDFDTERSYDRLTMNGRYYSGRKKPSGLVPDSTIAWESDEDTTAKGWKICPGHHFRGPEMFSVSAPCSLDAEGCASSPNYPAAYGPMQDCTIQVYNPENKSIVVKSFATEMLYDVLWVNGRKYAGSSSPHGLVPKEAMQWSSDEDIQGQGWKICPGPVGQQVPDVGGIEETGNEEEEYGYGDPVAGAGGGVPTTQKPTGLAAITTDPEDSWGGSFFLKVLLALGALCLAGVLCLRFKQKKQQGSGYGTPYGRSYAMDNL